MQGQRNSVESFPEAIEFEHGTNSSSSSMDQQSLWSTMLFGHGTSSHSSSMDQQSLWSTMLINPAETQGMPESVLPTGEVSMSYMNVNNADASRLSIWSSGGASSSQQQQNHGNFMENKLDHGWREPLRINTAVGARVDERHFETSNILSVGNMNINLNVNFDDDTQFLAQSSSFSDLRQNLDYAVDRVGTGKEASASSQMNPYSSGHISSPFGPLSPCAGSLADVGPMPEDDGREGSSLDGRRLACKRKNIEGFPGQSSSSGNTITFQQGDNRLQNSTFHNHNPLAGFDMPGSLGHRPMPNSAEDYPQRFGTIVRGLASECYPSASTIGIAESSHRNYRVRINPAQQNDIYPASLWSTAAIRNSHQWQSNQPSHHSEPLHGPGSSNAQNLHHLPLSMFPQTTYHLPWSGTNSRIGSSLNFFSVDDRMVDSRVEDNLRSFPVTSNLDFVPATETQPMAQDPVNWNSGPRGISFASTSRAGSSSSLSIYPPLGSPWVPYQSPATQYPRNSLEGAHQSPFASTSSEPGSQGMNYTMQRATHSNNLQDLIQLRASLRALQSNSHVRSAYNVERQGDGLLSAPLNVRNSSSREGRQRMISEIRLALESIRRANGLRFETVILAGADLHDRHRDMRLDVDNMSYEELLALGERIGNVSTGLSEETVSERLKQRKYFMDSKELVDVEPCCICQEEYVDGEDLGTLDCGHDFHSLCIRQWLMQKNLCPICKNTALVT